MQEDIRTDVLTKRNEERENFRFILTGFLKGLYVSRGIDVEGAKKSVLRWRI